MLRVRKRWLVLAASVMLVTSIAGAEPALADDSTGTVTGILTDGGVPVSAASVELFDTNQDFVGFVSTGSTGSYTFANVAPGAYVLEYDLTGGFRQFDHGRTSFASADPFAVTAGATTTVNESVLPHGVLSGHITNADGTPAADEFVQAASLNNPTFLSTTADSNGFYQLPYVPVDDYTVAFQPEFGGLTQYANDKTTAAQADTIHVAAGTTVTLDQSLVVPGSISGAVTDAHGQPVANAFVTASAADGLDGFASTGDDGSYQIPLFADTYTVQIDLPNGLVEFVHDQTDSAQANPVVVTNGANTVVNEQTLPTGTVSGRLVDSGGNPVTFANVSLANDSQQAFGSTDGSGNYSISAFPGSYRLEFDTPSGSQWASGETSPGQADPVVVTANQTTTVNEQLNPTGSITVTATDNVSGAPIESFCVFVAGLGNDACTQNGTAQFTSVLPGRYALSVDTDSGLFARASGVVVTSGQDTTTNVTVVEPATVTTTIVDATTGAPVANACLHLVTVTDPSTLGNSAMCSGPDGVVTAQPQPGTYKAFVDVRDGVHGDQWVSANHGVGAFKKADKLTLTSGTTTTLPTIKLDPAGSISGTITDAATGQPVPNGFASLASVNGSNGGGGLVANANPQGRYTLNNLGPYQWTLFIASPGNEAAEFSGGVANRETATGVAVSPGATTTFNVAMTPGTTLSGTVTGPDGTVTRQARVTVYSANTGELMDAADDSGTPPTYVAHLLAPQPVKLFYSGEVNGELYSGFVGGTDFDSATTFAIPKNGPKTINITMTQLAN